MRAVLLTLLSCLAATIVVTPRTSVAGAPLVPDPTPAVEGSVAALAAVGDRVVLVGDFDEVGGEPRSSVAALLPDGRLDPLLAPELDGPVVAVTPSPDGTTLFLAGSFTSVDGTPRDGLVALDATSGRVLRRWRPDVDAPVTALAVLGPHLVLGTDTGVRAVRLADGSSAGGFRLRTDGPVTDLAVGRDRLHLAGPFDRVAGRARAGLASTSTDGELVPFSPVGLEGPVAALAVAPGGDRLFAADDEAVRAYLPDRSDLPTWTHRTTEPVQALAAGTHRLSLAAPGSLTAVELLGGSATPWELPLAGGEGPAALLLTAQGLVAGGTFDSAGGHPVGNLLRVPTTRAVVSAGQDLRVRDDALVTLAGTVRLPDGARDATAAWRQVAGAPVELMPSGPATATFRPNPGRDTLAFELVAMDARGRRWQDAVTVDVVATPTVAVIGDSLTARVDARRDPPTREATTRALLEAAGWDADSVFWWARGGKTLTTPDRSGHTTFEDVRAATAALGGPVDLVYVGLGTNDSAATSDDFGDRVRSVLDALDASGAEDVVWMGLGFRDPDDPRAARLNPVLTDAVTARGWSVVDFAAHMHAADVFDPADWLFETDPTDRVHLTAQGYAERDALVVEALVEARDR